MIFHIVALGLTLLSFGYAALLDYLYREVGDGVWVLLGSFGAVYQLLMFIVTGKADLLSIAIAAFLALFGILVFYCGGWGGADAKGLIALSLVLPSGFSFSFPFFPMFCLLFACVFACCVSIPYSILKRRDWKKQEVPFLVYMFFGIVVCLSVEASSICF